MDKFRNKIKKLKHSSTQDPLVVGVYHIGLFPGWIRLVNEQLDRIVSSGLMEITNKLIVGMVGNQPDTGVIGRKINHIDFVLNDNIRSYEFPTLHALYKYSQQIDFKAWYIHTKGISSNSQGAKTHRLRMEKMIIDKHNHCISLLDEFDTCGIDWRSNWCGFPPHYGGNFWWANSTYLRTLPEVKSLNVNDRVQAEFWIGMNKSHKHCDLT